MIEKQYFRTRGLRSEIFEIKVNDRAFLIKGKASVKKKALELLPFQGKWNHAARVFLLRWATIDSPLLRAHRYPRRGSKNSLTCSSLIYVN